MPTTILILPAELRTQIYELYLLTLPSSSFTINLYLACSEGALDYVHNDFDPLPLSRTSRTIRSEFLPLWASHLTFSLSPSDVIFGIDQREIVEFLDAFGETVVKHCKQFDLPFCKVVLEGKGYVDEEAWSSARGNTYFVFVKPHEDLNERLLRGLLLQRLKAIVGAENGLTGRDVKELIFGPLRAMGKALVKWDPKREFDEIWKRGSCLRSRMRGL